MWLAIERGDAQLTWELWSAPIERSNVLTDLGKRVVREAVDAIAAYLGEAWPVRFLPNGVRSSKTELPLLSWHWWPTNDVPHVYARLLEMGSRLRLLQGTSGIGDVRRNMQSDLGQFAHSLLQLEVGGLAARAGWEVAFEPGVGDAMGRTDLLLARGGETMLVEVKGFLLDQRSSEDLAFSRRVTMALLAIESSELVDRSPVVGPPAMRAVAGCW